MADGQFGKKIAWLKHTSSYFRLFGVFPGAITFGSTETLMVRTRGSRNEIFLVFAL